MHPSLALPTIRSHRWWTLPAQNRYHERPHWTISSFSVPQKQTPNAADKTRWRGLVTLNACVPPCLFHPPFLPRAAVWENAGDWGRRRWSRSLLRASSRYTDMWGCSLFTTLSFTTLASSRSSVFGWMWCVWGGEGGDKYAACFSWPSSRCKGRPHAWL